MQGCASSFITIFDYNFLSERDKGKYSFFNSPQADYLKIIYIYFILFKCIYFN